MFSVVIPLYNKEHTIFKTINTVLNQTFGQFELIVVNDGSSDGSLEIVKAIKDERIQIIDQVNQGVSVARNAGVAQAKYSYIAFLDGDDEWKNNYLSVIAEAIQLYPYAGMFCCAGVVKNADGTEGQRLAGQYENKIVQVDFFENPHVFLHTSACVVNKENFDQVGGFPKGMKRNEDFALFYSIALITPVVYCGYPLSVYIGGVPGQATSTGIDNLINDIVARFNITYQNWLKSGSKNLLFEPFLRYELRHMVISRIRANSYNTIDNLIAGLDPGITQRFRFCEFAIYKRKKLRFLSLAFICLTKIKWRLKKKLS